MHFDYSKWASYNAHYIVPPALGQAVNYKWRCTLSFSYWSQQNLWWVICNSGNNYCYIPHSAHSIVRTVYIPLFMHAICWMSNKENHHASVHTRCMLAWSWLAWLHMNWHTSELNLYIIYTSVKKWTVFSGTIKLCTDLNTLVDGQGIPHIGTINIKLQYITLYNKVRHDQFLQILSSSDEKGLLCMSHYLYCMEVLLPNGTFTIMHVQIDEYSHTVYKSHVWCGMLLGGNYSL